MKEHRRLKVFGAFFALAHLLDIHYNKIDVFRGTKEYYRKVIEYFYKIKITLMNLKFIKVISCIHPYVFKKHPDCFLIQYKYQNLTPKVIIS